MMTIYYLKLKNTSHYPVAVKITNKIQITNPLFNEIANTVNLPVYNDNDDTVTNSIDLYNEYSRQQ